MISPLALLHVLQVSAWPDHAFVTHFPMTELLDMSYKGHDTHFGRELYPAPSLMGHRFPFIMFHYLAGVCLKSYTENVAISLIY